jgi:predicted lipoprotein with Yx(FWY)xxD motif
MRAPLVVAVLLATATAAPAQATTISLRPSPFGRMLWGPGPQAIYAFELDGRNRSNCHGECARLWPPVYTKGRPRAGKGVRPKLLGTIRRGSRRQVTYAGRPLYYYAHEGRGEVECHEVFLNGGLWWAIGARGRNRP